MWSGGGGDELESPPLIVLLSMFVPRCFSDQRKRASEPVRTWHDLESASE